MECSPGDASPDQESPRPLPGLDLMDSASGPHLIDNASGPRTSRPQESVKMSKRLLTSVGVVAVSFGLLAPARVAGQTQPAAAKAKMSVAKTWVPPRAPDGHPDLHGIWSFATITPLERPSELAGQQVLTDEQAAEFEKR